MKKRKIIIPAAVLACVISVALYTLFTTGKNDGSFEFGALVDLHLHLDGSISFESAKELASIQGLPQKSDSELHELMCAGSDCHSLNDFLTKFDYSCSLLQTEQGITLAVNNLLHELREDGLIYAEIRFAPQKSMDRGLTMEQVVEAAIAGLDDTLLPCRLILCCMRGNEADVSEANIKTIDMVAEYLGKGVVAADLAGAEALFPTRDYARLFSYAKEKNVPFVIHAGEADGLVSGIESIHDALEMGAARISHGVLAYKDAETMDELAAKRIPLTLCPTSDICTELFDDISGFPYRQFMRKGLNFCINTDDMTVENIDLRHEYELIRSTFGMTRHDAATLLENAVSMSFAPDSLKRSLFQQISSFYR